MVVVMHMGQDADMGIRVAISGGGPESVLSEFEHWTKDLGKSPIFWLNGLTGTGESIIA